MCMIKCRKEMTKCDFGFTHLQFDIYFPIPLAPGRGVEGCPLDYGLSAVRSVQTVGGGSASGSGDGRRPAGPS